MALTLNVTQPAGLQTDEIAISVDGTLDGTLTKIDCEVISPDNESYTFELTPLNFANPSTFPTVFTITPSIVGVTTDYFADGVYSVTITVDYSDATDQELQDYVLLTNRARGAWKDWMEKTACLNGGCGCTDCGETISSVREQIQAALIFYENSAFGDAKALLDCAYNTAKKKIN